MSQTVDAELTQEEAAHLIELIQECLERIQRVREEMALDQVEIEQLQAETRASIGREWKAA